MGQHPCPPRGTLDTAASTSSRRCNHKTLHAHTLTLHIHAFSPYTPIQTCIAHSLSHTCTCVHTYIDTHTPQPLSVGSLLPPAHPLSGRPYEAGPGEQGEAEVPLGDHPLCCTLWALPPGPQHCHLCMLPSPGLLVLKVLAPSQSSSKYGSRPALCLSLSFLHLPLGTPEVGAGPSFPAVLGGCEGLSG